jgi:hypothetical protein
MPGIAQEIIDSLNGERGERQKLIAETCMSICEILIRKNKDYGDSVFKTPILAPHVDVLDAILVRASDKVGRFRNLTKSEGEPDIKDESILDTITDLIGYLTLYLAKASNDEVINVLDDSRNL